MKINNNYRSGYVGIVGRPNVGKSTLLNSLLGSKISIVTPKPQTTRWQILGINTLPDAQVVYIDTPGIHTDEKRAMNRYMNRVANAVVFDADVIVFVVEATIWRHNDEIVLDKLKDIDKPVILALNKIDLLDDKAQLLPLIEKMQSKMTFADIVPISSLKNDNTDALQKAIIRLLPEGEAIFPEDQHTDRSIRFLLAEAIREKVIQATEQELPYATTVEIEQIVEAEKLTDVSAVIWVERDGQKAIVIGKKGERLKQIGMQARKDIEKLLGKKVFLRLWVKVKADWSDDEKALRNLGYE